MFEYVLLRIGELLDQLINSLDVFSVHLGGIWAHSQHPLCFCHAVGRQSTGYQGQHTRDQILIEFVQLYLTALVLYYTFNFLHVLHYARITTCGILFHFSGSKFMIKTWTTPGCNGPLMAQNTSEDLRPPWLSLGASCSLSQSKWLCSLLSRMELRLGETTLIFL